jgi:predicted tellurium resistance membrane protein TerC
MGMELGNHLLTLAMLIMLQAVLGFDNLLYISLESKRAPEADQARVRKLGIGLAIILRIVLLFVLVKLTESLKNPMFELAEGGWVAGKFSVHSLIVLAGGAFILYTAMKEIFHMIALEDAEHMASEDTKPRSVNSIIFWIVIMNLVFSFDSILSAMALTKNLWVMTIAIVISGILMIVMSDHVSKFLQKNRMYEVLGLFILFIVGILLLSEGAHLAHLHLFHHEITAMSKATFYFVIFVLVMIDIVQSRYQRKLLAARGRNMQRQSGAAH